MQNLDDLRTDFEILIKRVHEAQAVAKSNVNGVDSTSLQRDAMRLLGRVKKLSAKDAHEIKHFISTLIEDLDKLADIVRRKGKAL